MFFHVSTEPWTPHVGAQGWVPQVGATGFLGGEKRKYLTKDGVGEATDAVDVVVIVAATTSSTVTRLGKSYVVRLINYRHHQKM